MATADDLLHHADWLRALARQLLRDAHAADDLAQDTMVAALTAPPPRRDNLRGWLGTALRNGARMQVRGERRRRAREAAHVAATRGDDVDDRLATHCLLAEEVRRLAPAVRCVIVLRYFEGCSLRQVAARTGAPVPTVNTRLRRGLAELRRRLDRRCGDRRAWLAALLPLARPRARPAIATAAVPAFGTLLALLALAVAPWRGAVPAPANANGPGVGFAAAAMASPRPASIVAVRSEAETPDADGSRGGGEGVVTGTLLDVDDRPLAGVTIGCFATTDDDRYPRVCVDAAGVRAAPRAHAAVAATTRADGTFRCNVPLGDGRLRVVDDAWVTVMAGVVGLDAPPADVVVAAPARAIAGTVFDADGSPLDGATIECRLPATLRSRIARPLDRCVDETLGASSAPDGAFVIRAADVRGAELVFRHPNCTSLVVPRDAWRSPFVVRLAHADASSARALRVLDADGAPVAGAAVTCRGADALVETDAEGFAPLPRAAVPIAALRIVARGYLPHTVAAGDLRAAAPLAVVLREPAASIAGTVIGPSGAVVAGAWVWIADPEVLRDEPQRLELVESRLAGAATTWKVAVADQQGRFELTGLQDRRYTLRASLPRDVAFAELADVAAGTQSLRVCCSGEPCVATVRGRVVDTAGNVVAGAIVAAQRQALRIDLDGGRSMRWYANGRAVRTGDDGSFLLHDVPDAADLAVSAETVVSATFAPSAWRCGAPTFVVDRPCHLRVLAPAQPGLEFEIRDANGDVLPAQIVLGIASRPSARTPIVDGASAVVVVPSRAREVCLLDASGVVDRRSLRLDRAAVTVVTF